MDYITIDKENFIEYDTKTKKANLLVKTELVKELADAEARLAEIPEGPTDEELLEWAKENYPDMDYSVEKAALESIVELNKTRLEAI